MPLDRLNSLYPARVGEQPELLLPPWAGLRCSAPRSTINVNLFDKGCSVKVLGVRSTCGVVLPKVHCGAEAVPAGFPSPTQDYWGGDLDLAERLELAKPSTYFLSVAGHSMAPTIHDGALIVVNRERIPVDASIVVAIIDGEFTVKRLRKVSGRIWLAADNPKYPPIVIAELSELRIWGVVTWILHEAHEPWN